MIDARRFQQEVDGKEVSLYQFDNGSKLKLCVTNYGCRIVSLMVKDKEGQYRNVVIGFDSLQDYLDATEVYHGATIGRYANRIGKGRFSIGSENYELDQNNGPNHLHGGEAGFHTRVFTVEESTNQMIRMRYSSPDGEEGYPGKLDLIITIELRSDDAVVISYEATTDKATVINVTNHAYFNLNGIGSGPILKHQLQLFSDKYTPVDSDLIPTGELAPVAGTPFDFREPHTIGERINENHEQLKFGNGYDHNYVLSNSGSLSIAARAVADISGIVMETETDQPGIQFYTGNFMSGENIVTGHVPDHFRTAFCLETQHFPDSPNQPHFPSTVLEPGQIFRSTTVYRFSHA